MNAREAALSALGRCRRDEAWSGAVTDNLIKNSGLDKREAALASRLTLGVLQNDALCDHYIACYCKSAAKLEPKVRDILRLGVYQLLFTRVPARAAVNESVALCRSAGLERASGLVNAVLRRVAENLSSFPPIPNEGTAEHLAIKYSHPQWLVKRLIDCIGYGQTESFLACSNSPSGIHIQVNTLKIGTEAYIKLLEEAGIVCRAHPYLPGCLELEGGAVTELPGFAEGLFYVQDAAARCAADLSGAERGMRVLDCCAAPGGKSFAAAVRMGGEGSIISCDIHEKKLSLIRQGAERLGIGIIETRCADGRKPVADFSQGFDLVIADVPCSGMGVIGKKPEIRRKKEADIAALPAIQRDILENVSAYVKPGGALLYSTCTVLPEENEEVVRDFLSRHDEFETDVLRVGDKLIEEGMYTFWPHVDFCDGFFAARLIRKNV